MKRIHPNHRQAASLAAIVWLVSMAGCRNQPGGTVNPFLAPDRVPPPATRVILPGQAQPYYQGDPLPVMQSATQPTNQADSNTARAWNAPSGTSARATSREAPAQRGLAFSNEPTVAIPSDDGDLRFPLPKTPVPEPITPVANPSAPQQAVQLASIPAGQTVVPASYTEPVANGPTPASEATLDAGDEPAGSGPWRSPQIVTATVPTAYGRPPKFPGVAAVIPPANSMNVRLRAVPSPPPEPVEPTTPRIRLPGYAAPPPWSGAGTTQPIVGNIVQTLPMGPLPRPPRDPAVNLAAAPQSTSGGDGFRPRSSMR